MNFWKKWFLRLFLRKHNGVIVNHANLKLARLGKISGQGYCRLGVGNYDTADFFYNASPSYLKNEGTIELSDRVTISANFRILNRGKIKIGANSYINPNSIIRIEKELEIGSDCAISWGVTFMDDDAHHMEGKSGAAPIRIGSRVWIGANCTILKGVTIGDGCVIAAGSVVTKSFFENTLIGGIPAKVIKEDVHWER